MYLSYKIPTLENKALETIACPNIIKKEPKIDIKLVQNKPINEKFICETEEYAMIFFISICAKAKKDGKYNPNRDITKITFIIKNKIPLNVKTSKRI